ncbi:MAG: DUF1569 domain-containing protein [Acidobacteria bacterium]|nr:DUF1569 domain-containing protein [Acidobacteriota bacterium]
MKTLWDPSVQAEILARFGKLDQQRPPQWGKLSAAGMLFHVTEPLRAAMGEVSVASKSGPLRYFPLKQLIIYWLPFPKGAPTAPEFLRKEAGDWERDMAQLKAVLERFVARGSGGPWHPHPAFGELTGKDWGVLTYRHLDHHLRQFGG